MKMDGMSRTGKGKYTGTIKKVHACAAVALLVALSLVSPALAAQAGAGKKKQTPKGTPTLWREPGDIGARDLLRGPGADEMKPDLSSITFVEMVTGGYSTKYRVRDGAGRMWVVKVGKEAQPETACTRLLWAVGYHADINYLVPKVEIKSKGTFENARFEARPEGVERFGEWEWAQNPFVGTREFNGLKVLMVLFNNWDLKTSNNRIAHARGEAGDELRYVVSDLGATFGKTGNFVTHNRNVPKDYAGTSFVEGVEGRKVIFGYHGKSKSVLDDITVDDAKWVGELLSRLSDQQIQDAFRAANYGPEDVLLLSQVVRGRINELLKLQ
ncbi:MAG TPA: hypothetical protein VM934_16190 [Pyrinomonadaceae bacterium]|jgi:hypothetical protein|nr:hypothetical protein [Pyrinomonadaceae bacterium]